MFSARNPERRWRANRLKLFIIPDIWNLQSIIKLLKRPFIATRLSFKPVWDFLVELETWKRINLVICSFVHSFHALHFTLAYIRCCCLGFLGDFVSISHWKLFVPMLGMRSATTPHPPPQRSSVGGICWNTALFFGK